METEKVNVLYDENGHPVQVQVDFDLYKWLIGQVSLSGQARVASN